MTTAAFASMLGLETPGTTGQGSQGYGPQLCQPPTQPAGQPLAGSGPPQPAAGPAQAQSGVTPSQPYTTACLPSVLSPPLRPQPMAAPPSFAQQLETHLLRSPQLPPQNGAPAAPASFPQPPLHHPQGNMPTVGPAGSSPTMPGLTPGLNSSSTLPYPLLTHQHQQQPGGGLAQGLDAGRAPMGAQFQLPSPFLPDQRPSHGVAQGLNGAFNHVPMGAQMQAGMRQHMGFGPLGPLPNGDGSMPPWGGHMQMPPMAQHLAPHQPQMLPPHPGAPPMHGFSAPLVYPAFGSMFGLPPLAPGGRSMLPPRTLSGGQQPQLSGGSRGEPASTPPPQPPPAPAAAAPARSGVLFSQLSEQRCTAIRATMMRQQSVFVQQLFELHKICELQKLIWMEAQVVDPAFALTVMPGPFHIVMPPPLPPLQPPGFMGPGAPLGMQLDMRAPPNPLQQRLGSDGRRESAEADLARQQQQQPSVHWRVAAAAAPQPPATPPEELLLVLVSDMQQLMNVPRPLRRKVLAAAPEGALRYRPNAAARKLPPQLVRPAASKLVTLAENGPAMSGEQPSVLQPLEAIDPPFAKCSGAFQQHRGALGTVGIGQGWRQFDGQVAPRPEAMGAPGEEAESGMPQLRTAGRGGKPEPGDSAMLMPPPPLPPPMRVPPPVSPRAAADAKQPQALAPQAPAALPQAPMPAPDALPVPGPHLHLHSQPGTAAAAQPLGPALLQLPQVGALPPPPALQVPPLTGFGALPYPGMFPGPMPQPLQPPGTQQHAAAPQPAVLPHPAALQQQLPTPYQSSPPGSGSGLGPGLGPSAMPAPVLQGFGGMAMALPTLFSGRGGTQVPPPVAPHAPAPPPMDPHAQWFAKHVERRAVAENASPVGSGGAAAAPSPASNSTLLGGASNPSPTAAAGAGAAAAAGTSGAAGGVSASPAVSGSEGGPQGTRDSGGSGSMDASKEGSKGGGSARASQPPSDVRWWQNPTQVFGELGMVDPQRLGLGLPPAGSMPMQGGGGADASRLGYMGALGLPFKKRGKYGATGSGGSGVSGSHSGNTGGSGAAGSDGGPQRSGGSAGAAGMPISFQDIPGFGSAQQLAALAGMTAGRLLAPSAFRPVAPRQERSNRGSNLHTASEFSLGSNHTGPDARRGARPTDSHNSFWGVGARKRRAGELDGDQLSGYHAAGSHAAGSHMGAGGSHADGEDDAHGGRGSLAGGHVRGLDGGGGGGGSGRAAARRQGGHPGASPFELAEAGRRQEMEAAELALEEEEQRQWEEQLERDRQRQQKREERGREREQEQERGADGE